jgi:hypothetical protein
LSEGKLEDFIAEHEMIRLETRKNSALFFVALWDTPKEARKPSSPASSDGYTGTQTSPAYF